MPDTKVLVVDDSLTMRVLISRVLEGVPGIKVVGVADGADDARRQVEALRPDVMTLDIEMPGMNGIEYLAEIMASKPMPVIMFSTRTEAGGEASIEALRLGAVDTFPKPKVASQSEFDVILGKLGKRIKTAKTPPPKPAANQLVGPFAWNGKLIGIGADASGTSKLFDILGAFPENCPPTILVPHVGADLVAEFVKQLNGAVKPAVTAITDGMPLEQGKVYVTSPGEMHVVIDKWPEGRLRMLPRDPIAGERPSISLLFASIAKAAGDNAVVMMPGEAGEDGGAGVRAVVKGGGYAIAPPGLLGIATPGEFTMQKGDANQPVTWDGFALAALKLCQR